MVRCRSVLSVPGSNRRMIEKGLASEADLVFLDLEDAVANDQKTIARQNVTETIKNGDWQGRPTAFRCNGLDSPHCYRDLIEIYEGTGGNVDRVVVPKVNSRDDVVTLSTLFRQLEAAFPRPSPVTLDVQIETASGLAHCEQIATSDTRVAALTFGPGDFAASARYPASGIGIEDEWDAAYPGHRMHYPMSQISIAAHAAGIDAIDGPVANYRNLEELRRSARMARALGFDGKWCIHPDQIEIINEVFTPSASEVQRAKEILSAYESSISAGLGATALRDQMLDAASLRMARQTLQAAGLA